MQFFFFTFQLKCANCGDETPDFVYLDLLVCKNKTVVIMLYCNKYQ